MDILNSEQAFYAACVILFANEFWDLAKSFRHNLKLVVLVAIPAGLTIGFMLLFFIPNDYRYALTLMILGGVNMKLLEGGYILDESTTKKKSSLVVFQLYQSTDALSVDLSVDEQVVVMCNNLSVDIEKWMKRCDRSRSWRLFANAVTKHVRSASPRPHCVDDYINDLAGVAFEGFLFLNGGHFTNYDSEDFVNPETRKEFDEINSDYLVCKVYEDD